MWHEQGNGKGANHTSTDLGTLIQVRSADVRMHAHCIISAGTV